MSQPVHFPGVNAHFGPPQGQEAEVRPCVAMNVGPLMITCWELTDEEVNEIVLRRRVYAAVWSGTTFYPTYVGSPSAIPGLPRQYKEQLN